MSKVIMELALKALDAGDTEEAKQILKEAVMPDIHFVSDTDRLYYRYLKSRAAWVTAEAISKHFMVTKSAAHTHLKRMVERNLLFTEKRMVKSKWVLYFCTGDVRERESYKPQLEASQKFLDWIEAQGREVTKQQIADGCNVSYGSLTPHIKLLLEKGLIVETVSSNKRGGVRKLYLSKKSSTYSFNNPFNLRVA
jgi:DNA-binding MarR family transcriptional regulator